MKKVIYLLLALAFAMPSHGQVELKKHSPDLAGHNALIREWLDTVSISYVVTEKGEKYFVRDIRGHTTAVIAPIPREMTITDMEIVTEYLYFCGTYEYGNVTYGMVGLLNIPNTFLWGQPYHIGLFDWVLNNYGGRLRMTKPSKVGSTWNYPTSDIFISVVGEIELEDQQGIITTQTAVCEAFSPATLSSWECSYYWCDDPDITFTDITETDYYYVAVGRHNTRQTTLIKQFNVPVPLTVHPRPFTLLANNVNSGYIEQVFDSKTDGVVLTVATKNDEFVLTNYYYDGYSAGSTIKQFLAGSPRPVLTETFRLPQNSLPQVSPYWRLREIQYDQISGKTFILQDMDNPISPITESVVCEYDLLSSTLLGLFTLPGYYVFGMGSWSGAGFQIIGDNSGMMTYMRKKNGLNSFCGISVQKTHDKNHPSTDPTPITEYDIGYQPMIIPPQNIITLRTIKIIYDCIK